MRKELTRSELARLAQINYAREMAFIAVRNLPDRISQTIGEVRAVIDPDNVDAEFAVIVRSDLKTRGLGRILMRKLACSLGLEPVAAPTDADAVLLALNL